MFGLNVFVLVVFCKILNVLSCPEECVCTTELSINTVKCENKTLNDKDIERIASQLPITTEKLSLINNNIQIFPSSDFQRFTKLRNLDLFGNQLIEIPKSLPYLTKLDLSRNKINRILPGNFLGYDKLEEVEINENSITMLPGNAFSGLDNIRKLIINENKIENIGVHAFLGLNNLKSLSLEGNKIHNVSDGTFLPLKSMTHIYLSKNKLTKIQSKLFSSLNKLNFIDLQDNEIENIEKFSFRGLTLNYLLISNNMLRNMNKKIFEGLTINVLLSLSGNPLRCDCFLYYALIYLPPNLRLLGACAQTDVALNVLLSKNLLNCTRCSLNPCNKNQICQNLGNENTKCICKEGFSGKNCQIFDHCLAKPCLNFGNCANKKDYSTFFCKCKHPFIGRRCEHEISCAINHCKNGGQCRPIDHIKYRCECKTGFEGRLCEIKLKPVATQAPLEEKEPDITLFVALGCVCLLLLIALAVVFFIIRRKRLARKNLMVISSPILENHCDE